MTIEAMVFPVNLIVEGKDCLVVGDGDIAARKAEALEACGAKVTRIPTDEFKPGDCAGRWFVVTATGDNKQNAEVAADADAHGVWVNAADDPANGSAMLPARVRRGDVLVTVSTGGRSPALSRWLRRQLDATLEPELADLVDVLAAERDRRHASGEPAAPANWQRALDSGMLDLIREGRLAEAKELLQACLSSSSG